MPKRIAIIVGTDEYQDEYFYAPAVPWEPLAALLRDPRRGRFQSVQTVRNPSAARLCALLDDQTARMKRDDRLLLYLGGHMVQGERGAIYFATRDSRREALAETTLPATYLTQLMDRNLAREQGLILDCCYSSLAPEQTSRLELGPIFEGTGFGRTILSINEAMQDQCDDESHRSMTPYLMEGLQSGEADISGDGQIDFDDLYLYLYRRFEQDGIGYKPMRWRYRQQKNFVLGYAPQENIQRETNSESAAYWQRYTKNAMSQADWETALTTVRFWKRFAPTDPVVQAIHQQIEQAKAEEERAAQVAKYRAQLDQAMRDRDWHTASVIAERWRKLTPDNLELQTRREIIRRKENLTQQDKHPLYTRLRRALRIKRDHIEEQAEYIFKDIPASEVPSGERRYKWNLIFGGTLSPLTILLIGWQANVSMSIGMASMFLLLYIGLYELLD